MRRHLIWKDNLLAQRARIADTNSLSVHVWVVSILTHRALCVHLRI
jgi:hypothetical protein